jgi:hypothetical protein
MAIFNSPDSLIKVLNSLNTTRQRSWHNDGVSWFSASDYHTFGSESNGMQNQLAVYVESQSYNNVDELKIVLDIFNPKERRSAHKYFVNFINKTLKQLDIKVPTNLLTILDQNEKYIENNENYKLKLYMIPSNIATWHLLITPK